jgi:hypothetical protein
VCSITTIVPDDSTTSDTPDDSTTSDAPDGGSTTDDTPDGLTDYGLPDETTDYGSTDYGSTDYGSTDYGSTDWSSSFEWPDWFSFDWLDASTTTVDDSTMSDPPECYTPDPLVDPIPEDWVVLPDGEGYVMTDDMMEGTFIDKFYDSIESIDITSMDFANMDSAMPEMNIAMPEFGTWEGLSGGLDWQWGSKFDLDGLKWEIWNYSYEGGEWEDGVYTVVAG